MGRKERRNLLARACLPEQVAVERPQIPLEGGQVAVLAQGGLVAARSGAGAPPGRWAHEGVGRQDEWRHRVRVEVLPVQGWA
eukprot:7513961-Pyramimonas_sp.AAC.1